MTTTAQLHLFRRDVLAGLSARPRKLSLKYLYDARGSELFEQITRQPEYYLTRADLALHEQHLPEIAARIGRQAHIIELGSGAGTKTRLLLSSLDQPAAYTPIEISAAALEQSARTLQALFPGLPIRPLQADYLAWIDDEKLLLDPPARRRVLYFPGSTLGNFDPEEAAGFLQRMGIMAGPGGAILIGIDLIKSRAQMISAYDDAQGVIAAFNLNLLERLQRELKARLEPADFAHEARWNEERSRIELHLTAQRETRIDVDRRLFRFGPGESIHTGSSYKYSIASFAALAADAGLVSRQVWLDPEGLFSMHWLEVQSG